MLLISQFITQLTVVPVTGKVFAVYHCSVYISKHSGCPGYNIASVRDIVK